MPFSSVLEHSSPAILSLLRACKTIRHLNQVHAHIVRRGYDQDHFLIAHFISISAALLPTNLSYPTGVFHSVACPNIYLWNILLKANCDKSRLHECFSFFRRMRNGPNVVLPDKYTFPSLIKACSNSLALREGRIIHGATVRCGTERDVFVGSSLIDFYGKCGEIECARNVFDGMSVRNEVSWTAMMVGYLNIGDMSSAGRLFDEMPVRNEATWNAMIKGLVKLGDVSSARKLFDIMPLRSEVSFTTLIDGYAKGGDMASARSLFDQLTRKDLVSWSALMSGYVQNGKPVEAVTAFGEMQALNLKPDEFVMVGLMSACSQLGSLELAKWIESYMSDGSFDLTRAHVSSALVDMNAKCACSHAGLVDDGCRFFDLMTREYFISPSADHYACMVNLLGKAGKLEAAYELIRSMPVETHAGAWGALLEACRLHCDIDLGEAVARRLFEFEPRNAGNYVLLSNIYAEADMWLNVSHVRDKMNERGVRKIPGCSYVESTSPA
ncbi:putative pentatricopeptide repeat-containing protein at5g37570 [Phtheirospermum japonicum]|uniref:Putative pentatricopeptide repeat-containing protein at5g37570 n=1 Tax=Phtheirospermum japonicum TaxID=374723 RepID=A0A830D2D9_9LAMI|nr:putative pentatricopeptide repeat-containing protein at5g37570 [Phtheirospermum japonicum]